MTVLEIGYGEDSEKGIEGTGGGSVAGLALLPKSPPVSAVESAQGTELDLRLQSIEYFVSLVQMFGLPKSIGQIYGLLFVSVNPLSMDDIINCLGISKGSASQGLSLLKSLGAVAAHPVPDDRRDHFVADLNVSRIVTHFFENRLQPRLENGEQRLKSMIELARAVDGSGNADKNLAMLSRIEALQKWQRRGRSFLPLLLRWFKR